MSYIDETKNSSNSKIPYDDIPITRNSKSSRFGGGRGSAPSFKVFAVFLAMSVVINIALCISTIYFFKNGITKNIYEVHNEFSSPVSFSSLAVSNARWSSICVASGGSCSDQDSFFRNTKEQGGGVILQISEREAYFLTCYHVVKNYPKDVFVLAPSSLKPQEVELVGKSSYYDIAVLKTTSVDWLDGCNALLDDDGVYDSNHLSVGENVFAIGNPVGVGLSVSSGRVSQINTEVAIEGHSNLSREIQISCEINRGNSGGGLFDEQGRFIGLVNAKFEEKKLSGSSKLTVEGISYAIPGNLALNIARSMIKDGTEYAKSAYLGISLTHGDIVTHNIVDGKDIDIYDVKVNSIEPSSPASGLKKGDKITEITYFDRFLSREVTEKIYNKYFLEEVSFKILVGSKVTIKYDRDRTSNLQISFNVSSSSTVV